MTLYNKRIPVKGRFVKETSGYREADVQEAINNVHKRVSNVLPLGCIRDESDPDNCSCIACVRDSMRNEIKRIISDEFGSSLIFVEHAVRETGGKK